VRRSEQAAPAPGVVRVRLDGDTVGADVLAAILRGHPAVEILTGPDRYDDGRQYLTVRVRMDGGLNRAVPEAARDKSRCLASQCPPPKLAECQWPRCAAPPGLLPAPCDHFEPGGTSGLCATCGRSLHAHQVAAAAAAALWTDDDNDGGAL
jgi:hypothetical protein